MFQGIPSMMVAGGVPTAAPVGGVKKRSVTFNHLLVPSTQTNFPALINVTDVGLKTTGNGGNVTSANGYDIRPYTDSGLGTPITAYELESYNASTGNVVMWVNIASLSSVSDSSIYLRYGDSSITTDGSSNTTWDASFKGVWHLGNGTTLSLADSTSSGLTLTNTGSVAATTGKIGGGAGTFNGSTQALSTAAIDLTVTDKVTISAWINFSAYANDDDLLFETSTNFNSNTGALFVDPNSSNTSQFDLVTKNGGGYNGGWFTRPSTGVHYFVFTFDCSGGLATTLTTAGYVDGVAASMTQVTSSPPGGGYVFGNFAFYIMARAASSLFHSATYLDELRLSTILRSQNWITTEYNNQNDPATFETLGTEGPG